MAIYSEELQRQYDNEMCNVLSSIELHCASLMTRLKDGQAELTQANDEIKRLREALGRSIKSHEIMIELDLMPARYIESVEVEIAIMKKALEVNDE